MALRNMDKRRYNCNNEKNGALLTQILFRLKGGIVIKPQDAVIKETVHIAIGTAVMSAIMVIVFVLVGQFSLSVVWGALTGLIAAVGNFFLMAMNIQRVTTELDPANEDAMKQAKAKMKVSYSVRLLLMAVIIVLSIKLIGSNWIAAMLPLFFPRVTILIMQIIAKLKPKGSEY